LTTAFLFQLNYRLWRSCATPGDAMRSARAQADEKVALLRLKKIGAKLTKMTLGQSKYLGVPQAGPFKAESYRY
jgi:adenosylhomocysteinase